MLSNHIELDPELELEVVFKTKPENHIALSSHFTIAGIREAMDNYICRIFDVYPEIVPKSTV